MNLQDLGFTPFECDGITLHSKDFPEINYTLCESDNGTFTISTYEDGNVIVKLPIVEIGRVDFLLELAEIEIKTFRSKLHDSIHSLKKINKTSHLVEKVVK